MVSTLNRSQPPGLKTKQANTGVLGAGDPLGEQDVKWSGSSRQHMGILFLSATCWGAIGFSKACVSGKIFSLTYARVCDLDIRYNI